MRNSRERFLRTKVGRPSGVQSPQIASNKRRWNTSKSKNGRTKRKPIQFRLGKGFLFLFSSFFFFLLGAVEARTSQHCGRTSKLYVMQSKKENTDLRGGGRIWRTLCSDFGTSFILIQWNIDANCICHSTLYILLFHTSINFLIPPPPIALLVSIAVVVFHIFVSYPPFLFLSTSTKAITKLSQRTSIPVTACCCCCCCCRCPCNFPERGASGKLSL